jgi:flagellar FliJ protein
MNASDRFKPVLKVAENREAAAARQFGRSQQQQKAEEDKLENLRQYHIDYMQRFREAASLGMRAAQLREYQAFMSKLEKAISEQEEVVKRSQSTTVRMKQQWTATHVKTQSMDKAMNRMVKQEQKQQDAQDQKMSDELAQRLRRSH